MTERAAASSDSSARTTSAGPAPAALAGAGRLRRIAENRWLWRLVSFAVVFAAWEVAGRIPISLAFPTFSATVVALGQMLLDGTLLAAYAETVRPLVLGMLLCGVMAVLFGVGMGLSRRLEWFSLPVFIILQAAPMAALIPLITFLYGIGLTAKVLAVMLMSAPIIVLNSYRGIRNTNSSLLDMSRSFLATRRQQIVKVILPSASGLIFAGLRLGVAAGVTGVVLAELLITPTGVGDLITYYRAIAEYPRMFASILSIIIFSSVTVGLLQTAEAALFRPETRES